MQELEWKAYEGEISESSLVEKVLKELEEKLPPFSDYLLTSRIVSSTAVDVDNSDEIEINYGFFIFAPKLGGRLYRFLDLNSKKISGIPAEVAYLDPDRQVFEDLGTASNESELRDLLQKALNKEVVKRHLKLLIESSRKVG